MPKIPGSGRKRGTPNKFTGEFRHAVQLAFDRIGGVPALSEWASANPGEFYRICGRLIPGEVAARMGPPQLRVIVDSDWTKRPGAQTFENVAPALLKSEGGEGG